MRVILEPQRPLDGRLELLDVEPVREVPYGAPVELLFRDCVDFDPTTPGVVAAWLVASVVDFVFAPTARLIERDWRASYERERARLLDDGLRHVTEGF